MHITDNLTSKKKKNKIKAIDSSIKIKVRLVSLHAGRTKELKYGSLPGG